MLQLHFRLTTTPTNTLCFLSFAKFVCCVFSACVAFESLFKKDFEREGERFCLL